MKILHVLLWMGFLSLAPLTAQTSYYVNQATGSGGNNGTSPSTPLASVDDVFRGQNAPIQPGDFVYIMGEYVNDSYAPNYAFDYGGTPCDASDDDILNPQIWHGENTLQIRNVNGTPGNYITIRPYDQNTILRGDGANIFRVANCSYLRIEGFRIRGEAFNISLREAFALQFLYIDPNTDPSPDLGNLQPGQVKYYVNLCQTEEEVEALTFQGAAEFPNGITRPSYTDTRGMYLTDVHHIDVLNNDIQQMPGGGLRISKCEYVNVVGNEVAYNSLRSFSGTHGLVVTLAESVLSAALDPADDDTYRIKLLRNTIHHNYNEVYSYDAKKTAIEARLDEGKGISLQRNQVSNWSNSSSRFLVQNNVTYRNGFSGVHTNDGDNMTFVNNTAYLNSYTNSVTYTQTYAERFGEPYDPFSDYDPYEGYEPNGGNIGISISDGKSHIVKNNISVIDGSLGRFALSTNQANGIDDAGQVMEYDYNVIYVDDPTQIGNLSQDADVVAVAENTLVADPLFTDPDNFDFSLQPASPAIGWADAACAPSTDYNLAPRDANPDAGALEAAVVLPVDLAAFHALADGDKAVRIHWTTVSETGSDHFAVERSGNGTAWTLLGRVAAAGDSRGVRGYEFRDEAPLAGRNYYRLRQVDLDGTFAFSPMETVDFTRTDKISVYPNPTSGRLTVSGIADGPIRLLDATGREVPDYGRRPSGSTTVELDLSGLRKGLYYLHLGGEVEKIVVR